MLAIRHITFQLLLVELILQLISWQAYGQNSIRSTQSPFYWKNNKAQSLPTYWQQDVYYNINAILNDSLNLINGTLQLTYWNNSPDTLTEAYFNLYNNAYNHDSYYNLLRKDNQVEPSLLSNESNTPGITIESLLHNGKVAKIQVLNTLLYVQLNQALLPQDSCVFNIRFKTKIGLLSEDKRLKYFEVEELQSDNSTKLVKHFDIVQWYPKLSVYCRKFKWVKEQHLCHEFYGDFGRFEVSFTLPGHYILDGTGVLTNEQDVLPSELKSKLSLKQFTDKPIGAIARKLSFPHPKLKTWRFQAENVHDFGLTVDPTYRYDEVLSKSGKRCVALVREENAAGWQEAANFASKCIDLYEQEFGSYDYPKIIVADAKEGMEYPMLTLDDDISPRFRALIAHEIAHGWFYAMVGNNESYRPVLDEGIVQYMTAVAMERLNENENSEYPCYSAAYGSIYGDYLEQARVNLDGMMITHSDRFNSAIGHDGGYNMVYMKGALMYAHLRYLFGEAALHKAIRNYADQWKFKHPYVEDLRQSFTDYFKTDLNDFFDQSLESTKKIDYSIDKIAVIDNGRKVKLRFKRIGEMALPLHFCIVTTTNDTIHFAIPNNIHTKTLQQYRQLPQWYGWDKFNRNYTTTISLPTNRNENESVRFKRAVIDPYAQLGDVNRLNNYSGLPPLKLTFMQAEQTLPYWEKYNINFYPNLWWNGFSGVQVGASLKTHYLNERHKVNLRGWYNTGLWQINSSQVELRRYQHDYHLFSYQFSYENPLDWIAFDTRLEIKSQFLDGLHLHQIGLNKTFRKGDTYEPSFKRVYIAYRYLLRPQIAYRDYLHYPYEWSVNQVNASFVFGYQQEYIVRKGNGRIDAEFRTIAPGSDYLYSYLRISAKHEQILFSSLNYRTRVFGQIGEGIIPAESQLYLSGGNPEEQFSNPFHRSRGFFSQEWVNVNPDGYSHLHFGGGLNLRGFNGRTVSISDTSGIFWRGSSGWSFNHELSLQPLLPGVIAQPLERVSIEPYLFHDIGMIGTSRRQLGLDDQLWSSLLQDAGTGIVVKIDALNGENRTEPINIRFDLPVWYYYPQMIASMQLDWRWIISISKSF